MLWHIRQRDMAGFLQAEGCAGWGLSRLLSVFVGFWRPNPMSECGLSGTQLEGRGLVYYVETT